MADGIDFEAALAHLAVADPVLEPLTNDWAPHMHRPERDYFHALISAIVGQQISGKAADAIMRRVLDRLAVGGVLQPEPILAAEHDELRSLGLSNQKARYMRCLAEAVAGGELNLDALPEMDDEAVVSALTRVTGIGRWTAEMFLIFSLGRPDVLSTGDLGIRTAMMRRYTLEKLPAPAEMSAIAERWRPYRSTALLLLWHSLDNMPAQSIAGETFAAKG